MKTAVAGGADTWTAGAC